MSQYVKVNCTVLENVKPELVSKAVAKLEKGMTLEPTAKHKNHLRGNLVQDADSVICRDGRPIGVGLKLNKTQGKAKLSVVGDFWMSGFKQQEFIDRFCFNYQQLAVQQMQQQSGMTLIHKNVEEDGTLVLRYAC